MCVIWVKNHTQLECETSPSPEYNNTKDNGCDDFVWCTTGVCERVCECSSYCECDLKVCRTVWTTIGNYMSMSLHVDASLWMWAECQWRADAADYIRCRCRRYWPSVGNFDIANTGPTATVVDAMISWRQKYSNSLIARHFQIQFWFEEHRFQPEYEFAVSSSIQNLISNAAQTHSDSCHRSLFVISWLNAISEFL